MPLTGALAARKNMPGPLWGEACKGHTGHHVNERGDLSHLLQIKARTCLFTVSLAHMSHSNRRLGSLEQAKVPRHKLLEADYIKSKCMPHGGAFFIDSCQIGMASFYSFVYVVGTLTYDSVFLLLHVALTLLTLFAEFSWQINQMTV